MKAQAGTMESNDCLITVNASDHREIIIESIVYKQFGKQIKEVITKTLDELNIDHIYVHCQDKGALDYTIRARVITAIKRLGEKHA